MLLNASSGVGGFNFDFDSTSVASAPYAAFKMSGTEAMRIDSSGKVGIGTTSPTHELTVGDANAETTIGVAGNRSQFGFKSDLAVVQGGSGKGIQFNVNNNTFGSGEAMRINSSGNVGIGTTSPQDKLHVSTGTDTDLGNIAFTIGGTSTSNARTASITKNTSTPYELTIQAGNHATSNMETVFKSSDSRETMRIDSSGNVLVGTTVTNSTAISSGGTTTGVEFQPNGELQIGSDGDKCAIFNRQSSDGEILRFRKDGSTVGSIGNTTTSLFIGSGDVGLRFDGADNRIRPVGNASNLGSARDDAIDLGDSGARFDDIYATNGAIQTSDRNEKQGIRELLDAEQRVATACKGLLRAFKWNSAVEEKGDEARIHFGIIAQDLQDAFTAEGLDASDYAMFINSTWTDEETGEERSRMGVRYSELLAFIISAI